MTCARFFITILLSICFFGNIRPLYAFNPEIARDISFFSSIHDRAAGSDEAARTASYIADAFKRAGLKDVGFVDFEVPVPEVKKAVLYVSSRSFQLRLLSPNLVALSVTPPQGIESRLVYAGRGDWSEIKGKDLKNSIVLCEMDSGEFWLHAAALGAKALIYLGDHNDVSLTYADKQTRTPVSFPRFWLPPDDADALRRIVAPGQEITGRIEASADWKRKRLSNVYGFVAGTDEKLKQDLVIFEAPYDATQFVLGDAPGVDESTSVVVLLNLARHFARYPPKRSVLLVATAGKAQSFAGTRAIAWEIITSHKEKKKEISHLKKALELNKFRLEAVKRILSSEQITDADDRTVYPLVVRKAKDLIDDIVGFEQTIEPEKSDEKLFPEGGDKDCQSSEDRKCRGKKWVKRLLPLRVLAAKTSFKDLSGRELNLARKLVKEVRDDLRLAKDELLQRLAVLELAEKFRKLLEPHEIVLALSINLTSASPFLDIKQQGTLFPLRDDLLKRNRISAFLVLSRSVASDVSRKKFVPDLLPHIGNEVERTYTGQPSHLVQYPVSSDVFAIAGLPAAAVVSRDGPSPFWGTPSDKVDRWNTVNLTLIGDFLEAFLSGIVDHEHLRGSVKAGPKGLATLEGTTVFMRRGELFPDRPAGNTIVSVIQGQSLFMTMSYHDGSFNLPGVAGKKVAYQKLIIEPYGWDGASGTISWTANKRILRKESYRVQIPGRKGFTTLVMFPCVQTDVIDIFKPQTLSPLTKVTVLDAVTETTPSSYWFSRMDGRDTFSLSVFTEKGRRFKLLLSDTLVAKDSLFLNSDDKKPEGYGFMAGEGALTPVRSALDMEHLVKSRLSHLTAHGVIDQPLQELYNRGKYFVGHALEALENRDYGRFWDSLVKGWAKLSDAYRSVERTQRDVLTGVMFFIVLLVPFAYCLERFVFCFVSVYHQIAGFIAMLILSVTIVGWLHPAFGLTYSPGMVIIAFIIMGLAVLVIWIVFTRFEQEITSLRRAFTSGGQPGVPSTKLIGHVRLSQVMAIGLDIGTSNLHRRPLRTILTCVTIIILTFTIMSFSGVKSIKRPTHVTTGHEALYTGVMIHHPLWFSLSDEAWRTVRTMFSDSGGVVMPRSWVAPEKLAGRVISAGFKKEAAIDGVLGLSAHVAPLLAGSLIEGRWFAEGSQNEIILPSTMAKQLGISLDGNNIPTVVFQNMVFNVVGIFDEGKFQNWLDLNGKPLLPLFIEKSTEEELREAEVELIETGVELLPAISRFSTAPAAGTIILPHELCMKMGGELKSVSVMFNNVDPIPLVEDTPFGESLYVFAGKKGEKAFEVKSLSSFRYQGLTDITIPVLIVIAICFNTLIGHVQERKREISVYTSVGLAPRHVGMLFIVEALALAIISSVVGYILAQMVATLGKGLEMFSDISINYSSLASITSLMLIFVTVFLASIYPAVLASRMAMPDVEKSWTMPEPEGDVLSVSLPFIFRTEEHDAIMRYLEDFIKEHKEGYTGVFIVDDVNMSWADEGERQIDSKKDFLPVGRCLLMRFSVWLAPFDFGIQQRVHIYCCPASFGGGEARRYFEDMESQYVQIHLRIERIGGEATSWYRANRNFVRELRKAILRWHALSAEERRIYIEGTRSNQ